MFYPKAKMLIIGASSFAARGLPEKLVQAGYEVLCFQRGTPKIEGSLVYGSLYTLSDNPYLNDIDIVINFALIKDGGIADNENYLRELLEFCEKKQIKHLVHLSSLSVYSAGSRDVHEDTPIEKSPYKKGSYGALKVASDLFLFKHRPASLKITFVRPGFILGKGVVSPIVGMGFRIGENKLLLIGNKKNVVPLTTRDMVHESLIKICQKSHDEPTKVIMIVDKKSPGRQEWMQACCRLLGAGNSLVSFPVWLWKLAGLGGQIVARLLNVKISPWTIVQNACRAMRFHPEESERYLNMNFTIDWKKELSESFENQTMALSLPDISLETIKARQVELLTFIGYGGIVRQRHLDALKKIQFSGKISAYDLLPTQQGAQEVKEIEAYPDIAVADLTIVATPGIVHNQSIPLLQKTSGPVVVEKPLCYSSAEYLQWVELARSRADLTLVCHNYRFKKNVMEFMRYIKQWNPGKLLHVQVNFQSPPVAVDSASWRKNERQARTLLMDYSLHFLDIACMFHTEKWFVGTVRKEANANGETALISGVLTSRDYHVSFLLRQGFQPRCCRIYFTFQNYSISLGFFPDVFAAHMADDSAGIHRLEARNSARSTLNKILDKLLNRNSDHSHAQVFLQALAQNDSAKSISVEALQAFYLCVFELAQKVYCSNAE